MATRKLVLRILLPALAAALLFVAPACNNDIKLDHFLQGVGPSFVATHTFGQLLAVAPARTAHYLAVRLDPVATNVLTPSTGEVFFVAALDGLANCLVLKPKQRDEDDALPLDDLGPGLPKADKVRIALCNFDHTGGPPTSPLSLAIQTLYTDVGADDPTAEAAEFFDQTVDVKERKVDVWAAPEAVFPGPPSAGQKTWTSLGPAAGGVLHLSLFAEDNDGHKTYLNPAPYLAKIPLSPPASAVRPATFAEIRLESAADENFTTSLRSYTFDLGSGAMTPDETLGGLARVFFRLTNNTDDGGSTPVVVPHEITYELRELPAGTVRSHGKFFLNAFATSATLPLADLMRNVGDSLYRLPGAGAPETDLATEQVWMRLPVDPSPLTAGDPVPGNNAGELEFEPLFPLEIRDSGIRRFPPGDYELEIQLASGFGAAVSDVKVVRFEIVGTPEAQLTAANVAEAQEELPGAAVMLNDDNDNANTYPNPSGVAGKRPFEPWFDLAETAVVAGENDLMQLTIDVVPHSLASDAVLTVPTGGHRLRFWNTATKGAAGAEVVVGGAGLALPIASLPRTLWVEGIETGDAEIHLEHTSGPTTLEDTVDVHVVRLVEGQTWPDGSISRRVINLYATDVDFEVEGGTADFEYRWNLNGDGDRATDVFETGVASRLRTVRYDTAETAASVRLDETAANKRSTVDVSVELTGGLVLTRTIRVALATRVGAALPAQSNAGIQGVFAWANAFPITWDNVTPAQQATFAATTGITLPINAGNRIQHGPTGVGYAETHFLNLSANPPNTEIYFTHVNDDLWLQGWHHDEFNAVVNHEAEHLRQTDLVRARIVGGVDVNLTTVYRRVFVDLAFADARSFVEAEAHLTELNDVNTEWAWHVDPLSTTLGLFQGFYTHAVTQLPALPAADLPLAETLLRTLYANIPFDEMKRPDYDFTVLPPP